MYWCVALLVLLIANASQAKAEPPDERALRLVNHYRQLAGLTLVKLDQQLSAGCMEHAKIHCGTFPHSTAMCDPPQTNPKIK
jgi:hypothetical protein